MEKITHKFDEDFKKSYDEDNDKRYILEVDVEYPKNLLNVDGDLLFLAERKLKNAISLFNINGKENYVVHMRALKQALNHGLMLKKVHRVIQFNQEASLKEYIDMNTKLRTEAKNDFEEDVFKLMDNSIFGKTMENARKHRDVKLVTTDKRRNQLVSEPNYHTTKYFSEDLLAIKTRKIKVIMHKPIYLGMSIRH